MPHLNLHTWGSRWSLAPIVFQEGRDFVSCFILISSWSSALVHGRNGGSRGGSIGFGWRILCGGDAGALGLGVNECRVTRRNGTVGCRPATVAKIGFSIVNGSRCWCGIAVRVIRVEGIGNSFWGNWKRARSDIALCHRQWSFRRIGQFLSLLWLWVNCWRDPLFGTNRNWDCGPRYSASRYNARWISWIRIGIRHGNWAVNANRVGGWMVPFHMSWRTQGGGTKVWFRIFHHVGRDPSMCYHCWWYWRWRKRNESVQAAWSHVVKTKILRRQRVLPFNGGFEKGKKPCQIVQMHQSPSQVVMESTSLSVIHQEECHRKKERASEGWAKKLPKEKQKHTTNQEEKEKRHNQGKKEGGQPKPLERPHRKCGQASGKPLFDTVMGSSDAESRVDQKLSGVPPWETQRECTNELIGSDLVEHEKLGKHPWWRCGSVSGNHSEGQLEGKQKRVKELEKYWLVLDKSAPKVLFRA